MQTHSRRARRALAQLAEQDPALAALALWCAHRDAEDVADPPPGANDLPAWTDGKAIWYGPAFSALELPEQVSVAAHQVLHVAFRHVPRARAMELRLGDRFDPAMFNLAADALINETLAQAGYLVPRRAARLGPLLDTALRQLALPKDLLAEWDTERLTLALLGGPQAGPAQSVGEDSESGTGGSPAQAARDYARKIAQAGDLDTRNAAPGGTPEEQRDAVEWQQCVTRAMAEGRRAGRGLGKIAHRLGDLPRVDLPWERHLRALAARALRPDPKPDWRRPRARWLAAEADARRRGTRSPTYEPGVRRSQEVPRLVLGLDCSSSVEDATLALFAAQAAAIARRAGAEAMLTLFDTVPRETILLRETAASDLRRLRYARGGGTDFAPFFAEALARDPSALIVLTDLDAPLPDRPKIPVIWAVPSPPKEAPTWGRVLRLDR